MRRYLRVSNGISQNRSRNGWCDIWKCIHLCAGIMEISCRTVCSWKHLYVYTTEPTERDNWLLGIAQAAYLWRQYAIGIIAPSITYHPSSSKKLVENEVIIVAEFCLNEKLIIPTDEIYADRGRLGIFLATYVRKRNVYAQLDYTKICKAAYAPNWV